MNNFLHHIATTLLQNYQEKLSDCCLVFPNRRAGLFFTKYLTEIIDKPLFSPKIITINELVQELSDVQIGDNLHLVFDLYKVYKTEIKSQETFDDFYFWGEMLLNDFDDLDKELVDAQDMFTNLASLKEIDDQFGYLTEEQQAILKSFWQNFDFSKHSKHKDDFISIWQILYPIYEKYQKELVTKKVAYEGMVYKEVADKIKQGESLELPYEKVIFVGFNALNKAERLIFDYLQDNELAEFYWDYDKYYLENKRHEAGFFLRDNIKRYPSPDKDIVHDYLSKNDKNFQLISVPSDVGQAKLIPQIIEQFKEENPDFDYNKTAIVLADEHLLLPVLHSLPQDVDDINITMGYSLKDTPIYSLVEHIIELQKGIKSSKNSYSFYYKNVLAILNHQYIKPHNSHKVQQLIENIVQLNRVYVAPDVFGDDELLKQIFIKVDDVNSISDYLLDILHKINKEINIVVDEDEEAPANLEQEYIYYIYLELNKLKEIITKHNIEFQKLDTFLNLLKKIIQTLKIPFTGEPLAGLQVMGILETRVLDFDNLIILSMNEGVLPATGAAPSFIPYNLRKGFGMPTIEYQDAIYGYYFYRLIQRAKNITMLYNSQSSGSGTGEMSRFIYQLKYESDFKITEKNLVYDLKMTTPKEIAIQKSDDVIGKLKEYLQEEGGRRYFSPSAINTYLDCSLKFYFRYIAGLKEPDEINEEIDPMMFGNLLHEAMNILYLPFKGKLINTDDIDALRKDKEAIKQSIIKSFKLKYFNIEEDKEIEITGRNILIYEILKKYIRQVLKVDKRYTPFEVKGLEEAFKVPFPVTVNDQQKHVTIGGAIDRIDRIEGAVRIIDYKTGTVKDKFKDVDSLFIKNDKNRSKAVFQTFLYAMAYEKMNGDNYTLTPAIYWLKDAFNPKFDYHIKQTIAPRKYETVVDYKLFADDFESKLQELLEELFNPELDFIQTEEEDSCKYCPYIEICHRD